MFYDVIEEPEPAVLIRAVGVKIRNRVWIADKEIEL
jgi:hypothetical protein